MIKRVIYADQRGSLLPDAPWEGSVQSTYSRVVNLLHPSGILISIVDSLDNMTDYGLTVKNFGSLLSRITIGSIFLCDGDRIIFPDTIINIFGASVWSGILFKTLYELSIDLIPIKDAFNEFAAAEGLAPVVTKRTGNLYSNTAGKLIEKAVGNTDVPGGFLIDLSPLVGLGIGFTPSGDDFLAGVLLYEAISGIHLIDKDRIREKLSGTTEGGRTLLTLALHNSFPFYLIQFSELICTGTSCSVKAVKMAVEHGSTSGSDSLAGFLWAAEKIEKQAEFV